MTITKSHMNAIVWTLATIKIVFVVTSIILAFIEYYNNRNIDTIWKPSIYYCNNITNIIFRIGISALLIYYFWGYTPNEPASKRVPISKAAGVMVALLGLIGIINVGWDLIRPPLYIRYLTPVYVSILLFISRREGTFSKEDYFSL